MDSSFRNNEYHWPHGSLDQTDHEMPENMKLISFLGLLCLGLSTTLQAQNLSRISARWSDSFVEWDIFQAVRDSTSGEQPDESDAPDEESIGDLKLRWLNLRDDWSEWDFNLGDLNGNIRLKWKNDPTAWELRTFDGDIVTMRAMWTNDFSEWRVTDNTKTLTLKSRWKNYVDEWMVNDSQYGNFYLYTLVENDPRDWAIEDHLDDSVSPAMRMALIFLIVYHAAPKI